jgi:hypothetical protein
MSTLVLDPIAGLLRPDYEPASCLYEHDWTTCARRRQREPITDLRLFMMVLAFADAKGARDDRETHTVAQRRELARMIDYLHHRGARWPMMPKRPGQPDTEWWPLTPAVRGATRPQSPRIERGYCVRWTGAFWAPCSGVKERRAAGYLPLMMCWPPPLPKFGEYLSSGPRARFIYRIAEVERFRPPRTAKRLTCRLWCERVLPEDVPRRAVHHAFYWHARSRAA